jgi:hypothetical protein
MLSESVEMRWFLADDDARVAVLKRWFENVKAESERHDYYAPTARADLGIKVRQEGDHAPKLETKFLVKDEGERALSAGVKGRFERWKKVSMELADFGRSDRASFVHVAKERQLRKFAFEEGQAKPVSESDRPDVGCGVELTRLSLDGQKAVVWTVGFEAFGANADAAFDATATKVLAEKPELTLEAKDSKSYPEWLLEFVGS